MENFWNGIMKRIRAGKLTIEHLPVFPAFINAEALCCGMVLQEMNKPRLERAGVCVCDSEV